MPIKTAEEFLAVLERSNLLTPAEFAEAMEISQEFPDATQFAKALAREEIITRWQAGQLLAGRSAFFLGKYRLINLLGRGGMGSVFLAEHVMMHRRVALKILPRTIAKNPAALQHFLAEARTIAALDHSNIVRAYSVDNDENDRYYLVMEYVEGLDLQRVVEAKGPLDCESAVDCLCQAADGLAHAHARNMIHCDIKPSNLILNEQGIVKILDMGLARLVGRDQADGADSSEANKHILGSVDYLAPEQAMATPDFDHRADIYALGCTMYFLLTGHPPFPGGTLAQRIVKHQTQLPPEISRERPEVPATLTAICLKMMAKNPADRYQSAAEVSDALAAWKPEVPQPEDKPTAIYKIVKLTKEIRARSPWEMEFNDELKSLASISGGNEFGLPSDSSGKFPVLKNNPSSGSLAQTLFGTPGRLILSCSLAAVFVVALLGGIVFSIVYSGNSHSISDQRNPPPTRSREKADLPPPPDSRTSIDDSNNPRSKPPSPPKIPEDFQTKEAAKTPEPTVNPSAVTPPTPEPSSKTDDHPPAITNPPTEPISPANPDSPTTPDTPPPTPPVAEPLKELAFAVELPDLPKMSNGNDAASTRVSLGKVHLDAKTKLQIELIGADKTARGKYVLEEDLHAGSGQAWNLMRIDLRGNTLIARLKLKEADLMFEWSSGANPLHAGAIKNCGVSVTAGDVNRFVQFRMPKNAESLKLDFVNGVVRVSMPAENLPDISRLQLKIDELGESFPARDIKLEAPVPGTSTKRMVEIAFTDQNFSNFSIHVNYDVNRRSVDLEATGALSFLPKAYRFQSATDFVTRYKAELEKNKNKLVKMNNNNPARGDLLKLIGDMEGILKKLDLIMDLAKNLNGKTINYRIVAEYDKYQIEYFNSRLTTLRETAQNAKMSSARDGVPGKKDTSKE